MSHIKCSATKKKKSSNSGISLSDENIFKKNNLKLPKPVVAWTKWNAAGGEQKMTMLTITSTHQAGVVESGNYTVLEKYLSTFVSFISAPCCLLKIPEIWCSAYSNWYLLWIKNAFTHFLHEALAPVSWEIHLSV